MHGDTQLLDHVRRLAERRCQCRGFAAGRGAPNAQRRGCEGGRAVVLITRAAALGRDDAARRDEKHMIVRQRHVTLVANGDERILRQSAQSRAENGGVILAASERAHTVVTREAPKAVAILYRAQIVGEIFHAPNRILVFDARREIVCVGERNECRDYQRARAAQSRRRR